MRVTEFNVGRFCKSEDDCIADGIDFAAYERGVADAAAAFGRNAASPAVAPSAQPLTEEELADCGLLSELSAPSAQEPQAAGVSERLERAVRDAATSLETISQLAGRKTYGDPPIETFMDTFMDVRSYAAARARAARDEIDAALAAQQPPAPAAPGVPADAGREEQR